MDKTNIPREITPSSCRELLVRATEDPMELTQLEHARLRACIAYYISGDVKPLKEYLLLKKLARYKHMVSIVLLVAGLGVWYTGLQLLTLVGYGLLRLVALLGAFGLVVLGLVFMIASVYVYNVDKPVRVVTDFDRLADFEGWVPGGYILVWEKRGRR